MEPARVKPEPLRETSQTPRSDARQTRLDEIGRALNHYKRAADPLLFTNSKGVRIPFEPGTIWVLIDAPL